LFWFFLRSLFFPPPPLAPLSSSGAPGLSTSSAWGWLGCSADPVSSSSPEQSPRGKKIGDCRVGERTETSTPNFSGFVEVSVSILLPYPSLFLFLSLFLVAVAAR